MSDIFNKLLESRIESFINEFQIMSKNIFLNPEGTLIHPGEFGSYRERIVGDLLRIVTPGRLEIGSGFIITADNKVSTQCDIVIFDRNSTPLLESKNNQRFFPIETVAGIIEVKSNMSKSDLIDALKKISKTKMLRDSIPKNNSEIYRESKRFLNEFDPLLNVKDQIGTFIICNKFDFDIISELKKKPNFLDDVYSKYDTGYRHNMVLSIDDGLLYYHDGVKTIYYPYFQVGKLNKNIFLKPTDKFIDIPGVHTSKYEHVVAFLNYYHMLISSVSIMYIEITNYIGGRRASQIFQEIEKND